MKNNVNLLIYCSIICKLHLCIRDYDFCDNGINNNTSYESSPPTNVALHCYCPLISDYFGNIEVLVLFIQCEILSK